MRERHAGAGIVAMTDKPQISETDKLTKLSKLKLAGMVQNLETLLWIENNRANQFCDDAGEAISDAIKLKEEKKRLLDQINRLKNSYSDLVSAIVGLGEWK